MNIVLVLKRIEIKCNLVVFSWQHQCYSQDKFLFVSPQGQAHQGKVAEMTWTPDNHRILALFMQAKS